MKRRGRETKRLSFLPITRTRSLTGYSSPPPLDPVSCSLSLSHPARDSDPCLPPLADARDSPLPSHLRLPSPHHPTQYVPMSPSHCFPTH